uniref:hypothetical protein n=1 Tax=Eubacterium cellulosolvens TaxID=29322 RepID=UPI0004876CDD|nr:hypothetical protein [[Eubacterium] cellulosolvens]
MKKIHAHGGEVLIILGLVLLLASGGIIIRQKLSVKKARVQTCSEVLQNMQKILPSQITEAAEPLLEDPDSLPVAEVNGMDCIGKIEFPQAGISFPVGSSFLADEKTLIPKVLPDGGTGACRIGMVSEGSAAVRDGDEVIFTGVSGFSNRYVVDLVTREEREAVGGLIIEFSDGLHTTYVSCVTE